MDVLEPVSFEQAAEALAGARGAGHAVRIRGAATKSDWGLAGAEASLELRTRSLGEIVEHNAADLTAVLQAGVPLARAQSLFASAGQMLALDPPLGDGQAATIGGVVATGDSGPLRHRYGTPRDLVIGITVALSDGTIARAGGKVIKNVAGYDLAKLFAGSFGTLGMILSVNVRLHPQPPVHATAIGSSNDAAVLQGGARALSLAPLEFDALDVAWSGGRGRVLARCSGAQPAGRAQRAATLLRKAGFEDVDVIDDDTGLWARQRGAQRSASAAILRVAARPSALAAVLRASESCGASLVGRAGLGASYVELDPSAVARFRAMLPPGAWSVLLDAPSEVRRTGDPWGASDEPALALMRSVKRRFDPSATCNPGVFVGGI